MRGAVHSDVDAVGYCRNCGKAMCSTCVRPVRDVLYCEECLAGIVGIPGANPAGATSVPGASGVLPPPVPVRSSSSPGLAFVLGFVFPGLGAVYNGQYNKALIQIVVFATFVFGLSRDRKSTRLNSSHQIISYAVFCLKKKKTNTHTRHN